MKSPNHNEAGMIAFSLVSAILDELVAKGIISDLEMGGIIISAADGFRADTRLNARACEQFLRDAAKAQPSSKQV